MEQDANRTMLWKEQEREMKQTMGEEVKQRKKEAVFGKEEKNRTALQCPRCRLGALEAANDERKETKRWTKRIQCDETCGKKKEGWSVVAQPTSKRVKEAW